MHYASIMHYAADENMMSYQYRICVTTNKSNAVPVPKPAGYNPADFELARRQMQVTIKQHYIDIKQWWWQ
jgi:hypothetical protein